MQIEVGQIVRGRVCGIKKYGIFVDLSNGDFGLIHISEVSDDFVKNINDYVTFNQVIEAKVIGFEKNMHRYNLSIKDINYDLNNKKMDVFNSNKNGFNSLSKELDKWIKIKLIEYNYK